MSATTSYQVVQVKLIYDCLVFIGNLLRICFALKEIVFSVAWESNNMTTRLNPWDANNNRVRLLWLYIKNVFERLLSNNRNYVSFCIVRYDFSNWYKRSAMYRKQVPRKEWFGHKIQLNYFKVCIFFFFFFFCSLFTHLIFLF